MRDPVQNPQTEAPNRSILGKAHWGRLIRAGFSDDSYYYFTSFAFFKSCDKTPGLDPGFSLFLVFLTRALQVETVIAF